MRLLNLLLIVPIVFSAGCGARTDLDTLAEGVGGAISVGGATAAGGTAVVGGAPGAGGASTVTCGIAGSAGASSTVVGVITVLSALPTCVCPNNPQCEATGYENGCFTSPCVAAQ